MLGQSLKTMEDFIGLIRYNLETAGAVLTYRNQVRIFTDGRSKFAELGRQLRAARRFIHIQYYIIKNDEVFGSIAPILMEKARQGVEVRILYDGMGGRFMPQKRWEQLRSAGVKVAAFVPVLPGRLNLRINYRNHRKIAVIDGRVGFVGGFNIGREYISKDSRFGYWRDTHLEIMGDAAAGLQILFALDWNKAAGENLFQKAGYFETEPGNGGEEGIPIQIVASGPDAREPYVRNNYLELFYKARRHFYIQTPYFIPDAAVLSALKTAALSGVRVCLMIPCKPDHPFVYGATRAYAGELLNYGVRCYIYENGFLHSKAVMVDGAVSCCGTANMDIRSFKLNFEVNAVVYDSGVTGQLEQAFLDDLPYCRELTREDYQRRGVITRFKERLGRLFSPLL